MRAGPALPRPPPQPRRWRRLIALRQKLVGQRVRVQDRARALPLSRGLSRPLGHRAWAGEGLAELEGAGRRCCGGCWRGAMFETGREAGPTVQLFRRAAARADGGTTATSIASFMY